MKAILTLIVAVFGFQTLAANETRQHITCVEKTKRKIKISISADFNPTLELETIWRKVKGQDSIITYKQGDSDSSDNTTARATLKLPTRYPLKEYYEVNTKEPAGSGYSGRF